MTNPPDILYVTVTAEDSSGLFVQVVAQMLAGGSSWNIQYWYYDGTWHGYNIWTDVSAGDNVILTARVTLLVGGGYIWVYEVSDVTTGSGAGNNMVTTQASGLKNVAQEVYAFESYTKSQSFFSGKAVVSNPSVKYYDRQTATWSSSIGANYVMTDTCLGRFGGDYAVGGGAGVPSWWNEKGHDQDSTLSKGQLSEGYALWNGVNSCTTSDSPRLWGP